jgi:hypothetical protein
VVKKTLATEAQGVSDYLTAYAYMLADVIKAKDVPEKDKKWIRKYVLAIMQTQSVLDIGIAYNNVMKLYKPKDRKRMEKLIAKSCKEK